MFGMQKLILAATPLAFGLAFANFAIGADGTGPADAPFHCEIVTGSSNGMTTLEGVVHSNFETRGTYRFRVASAGGGGGSNIQQGGSFAVGPEGSATLGRVMLNSGAIYDAELEIAADGDAVTCSKRVGNL